MADLEIKGFNVSEFQAKLTARFGTNIYGDPVVKLVHGLHEREIKPDGTFGLKYSKGFGKPKVKDYTMRGLVMVPHIEREEIGIDRFIVERWIQTKDPAYPRGRYVHYYEVEDERGEARVPGDDTIEHVARYLANQDKVDRETDRALAKMIEEEDREAEQNARPAKERVPNIITADDYAAI